MEREWVSLILVPLEQNMFFEVNDAFIHIDLKTVQTRNIGDITNFIK